MLQRIAQLNSKGKKYALRLYYKMQLERSKIFDKAYYLNTYPDVAASNHDPIWHYLSYGATEGRNPSWVFDTEYYFRNNEDVRKSGMNPLVHYIKFGDLEGRRPHPLFDNVFYRATFGNKMDGENISLEHYLKNASDFSLRPHPLFHTEYYVSKSMLFKESPKCPLVCYLENRHAEKISFCELLEPVLEETQEIIMEKDAFAADYIRHIEKDAVLKSDLIERLEEGDLEGLDYLYRSTLPSQVYGQLQSVGQSGKIHEVESLYEFSKKHNAVLVEEGCETWTMYSASLKRNIKLTQPKAYIARLQDVKFVGGTRLILKNEKVLHDELAMYDHSGKEYGVKLWHYTKVSEHGKVEIFNAKRDSNALLKKGILISCDHDNNYFHWMVECMAKLSFVKTLKEYEGYPILIAKTLHPNLKIALNLLAGENYPIYELEEGTLYKIDELIIPSDLSRVLDKYSGEYNAEIDVALSKKWVGRVKAEFCKNNEQIEPYRKLYLTRKTGTYRKLMNEEELELTMLKNGFEVIDLSTASLAFQQTLFSQAKLVVAPTGATITNMLLSPNDCKFIVLTSNHEGVHFNLWEQLAEVSGVQLANAKGSRMYNRDDFHDDYTIDIEGLLKLIEIC